MDIKGSNGYCNRLSSALSKIISKMTLNMIKFLFSKLPTLTLLLFLVIQHNATAQITQSGDTVGLFVETFETRREGLFDPLESRGKGLIFGERLVGQIRIDANEGFRQTNEVIEGIPSTPLTMVSGTETRVGVRVRQFGNFDMAIAGENEYGSVLNNGSALGGLTVLYPIDQETIGFDILGDPGVDLDFFDIQFFDRNGNLLDDIRVDIIEGAPSTPTPYVFSSSASDIAAITIDRAGLNVGGAWFDNFLYKNSQPIVNSNIISLGGDISNLEVIDFDSLNGMSYTTLSENGITFGEKLVGQITTDDPTVGLPPPTDIVSGIPNIPLTMDNSISADISLEIFDRDPTNRNIIAGNNSNESIGEGALTVLYEFDQSVISFDIANGDSHFFDIQFFDRNGNLLDDLRVPVDQGSSGVRASLIFSSPSANIAAITIDNSGTETGGGLFDNFRYSSAAPINTPPNANAGLDQSVFTSDVVTLDGSGSTDADGDPLTFTWSLTSAPAGSLASLSDPTVVNPTFTADVAGTYVATLIVNDDTEDSAPDTVSVSTINVAPVADAGPDQSVLLGSVVTLDGSGSNDADGDALDFSWIITSVPVNSGATLSDANTVNPTFIADLSGTYIIDLVVSDGALTSVVDSVSISTINVAPVADPGMDQSVFVGSVVTLDGSASSDIDGDPLTYNWNFTATPTGSTATLTNPTTANPTFTVDVPGTYVISLVVNDGSVNSQPDTVSVSTINVAPIADAGPDQSVFVGDLVTLDSGQSMDADGDSLTYQWSLTTVPAGSAAVLTNSISAAPSFTADVAGTYVVSLLVNDGTINSAPDTVSISTINVAPVADAGPNQSVLEGTLVSLDGSGSNDADGDPLTYQWSLTSAPAGSFTQLNNSSSVTPTITPDIAGMYVISLVVNDGVVNSAFSSMTLSVISVEDAATDQTQDIIESINTLDSSVFKNKNNAKALTNKLNTVILDIQNGDIADALSKLENDITKKTDGCANQGSPDNNDWVEDCVSQDQIYPLIQELVALLQNA